MRTLGFLYLMTVVISGGTITDAQAQGNSGNAGKGRSAALYPDRDPGVDIDIDIVFDSGQLSLIRAWFRDSTNLSVLPPGLAKREALPPGLQRQLRKNGTLPPGLQAKSYPFPVALERRLPDLRLGVRRTIIGGVIVLLDGDVILDIAAIF